MFVLCEMLKCLLCSIPLFAPEHGHISLYLILFQIVEPDWLFDSQLRDLSRVK